MYIENRNLRGVQKFVDTKVVRRNSIGSYLVSANSCTLYLLSLIFGGYLRLTSVDIIFIYFDSR